jgi:hypothetical protein
MKPQLWSLLAVSYFAPLGNGQDGAVAPTIVQGASGPGIQGNVGWTRAQQDAELERASLAARQKKALMESIASHSQKLPVITSAEQYLQVHRPAMPRSPEGSRPTPEAVRSNNYVPAFENASTGRSVNDSRPAPVMSGSSPDLPEKKTGWLGLFKSKEKAEIGGDPLPNPYSGALAPPAASDPEISAMNADAASKPPSPAPSTSAPTPDPGSTSEAIAAATEGASEPEKTSIFGRLFGKPKAPEPSVMSDPTLSASTVSSAPPLPLAPGAVAPGEPVGIPSPPSFSAPPQPASVPSTAPTSAPTATGSGEEPSIFVRRAGGGAAGARATVLETNQAMIAGVLVRLYEGSSVVVLERSGSMARIRLADGREGTIAASALSR